MNLAEDVLKKWTNERNEQQMKKIFALFTIIAMMMCMVACSHQTNNTVKMGEEIQIGDISFKVSGIEYASQITYYWTLNGYQMGIKYIHEFSEILRPTNDNQNLNKFAEDGKTFALIDFELHSNGQEEVTNFEMKLNYGDKKSFECEEFFYEPDTKESGHTEAGSGVSLDWNEGHKYRTYTECYKDVQIDAATPLYLDVTINEETFRVIVRE